MRGRYRYTIGISIVCALLIIFGIFARNSDPFVTKQDNQPEEISETRYDEMKEINADYIGWLSFESDLISKPVVQTIDNKYYLTHDFECKENSQGTVFADKICSLEDQNITLYGHYVYKDENAMFTPLTWLKEPENYSVNSKLTFELQDEIRYYQIAMVYIFDMMVDTEYPYMTPRFEKNSDFVEFVKYADKKKLYNTDVKIDENDNILTLQTCVRNDEYKRLIVVAKEISREPIE